MQGTVNLSRGFSEEGTEIENQTTLFPGGEVYVKVDVPDWCSRVRINSRCNNSEDLMKIIMTADAIKRQGIRYIDLFIPYLPYSRQDRICHKGESFSLKVMCKMLASCGFMNIHTYDAHSNVAEVLLDNLCNYDNIREVRQFMANFVLQDVTLIVPDVGASKKAITLYNEIDNIAAIVQCNKVRAGGSITVDKIEANIKGKTVLVVDDICDGGGTFLALAVRLLEANVEAAYLFVSHGIFSKGLKALKNHYEGIGCTNSIRQNSTEPDDCIIIPIIY